MCSPVNNSALDKMEIQFQPDASIAKIFHASLSPAKFVPSGGPLQLGRVAAAHGSLFVASSNKIQKLDIELPEVTSVEPGRQGPRLSQPIHIEEIQICETDETIHKTEIQHLEIAPTRDGFRFGSIDASGRAQISIFKMTSTAATKMVEQTSQFDLKPSISSEYGWSGLAFHPEIQTEVATASYFGKWLNFYDEEKLTRSVSTRLPPTQLKYTTIPNSSNCLLAAVENNVLSFWDCRVQEKHGCVRRLQTCSAPLYAIDSSSDGMIGVCGTNKVVHIYDPRKWSLRNQWKTPMKYEAVWMKFSNVDTNLCYVAGLDHEIICGDWTLSKNKNVSGIGPGFRGDSKWVGLDLVDDSDLLLGVTQSGSVYVIENPYLMHIKSD